MDFNRILALSKHHRRAFIAVLLGISLLLAVGDYLLLKDSPAIKGFLSPYVQAIVEAILVGLFVLLVFTVFTPTTERGHGLEQLEPYQINLEFESLLASAERWRYKGNFGRFERGKVLPMLANKHNAQASLSVIDPRNERLCTQHAEYRNNIQAIDKGKRYDADAVALEVIITIVHCAWYIAKRKVDISLYLSSVFDPVRIDSNDDAMILTVEDRRSPALKLSKTHFMYGHFELQMRYAREQGYRLDLQGLAATESVATLDARQIEQFLAKIGMAELCARLKSDVILNGCRESKNPYAD